MVSFSEKYGYETPSSTLVREAMTDDIINATCTGYDLLCESMNSGFRDHYKIMEEHLWCKFLNKRLIDFQYPQDSYYKSVTIPYLLSSEYPWYKKLDLVEATLAFLSSMSEISRDISNAWLTSLVTHLNLEFERLNFAYRIVENQVIEITSEEEIATISTAFKNSSNGVKEHLKKSVELLSKRPNGDYRNSIKESISAVEAYVREITGSKTLNFAELERNGVVLPAVLKQSFEKLYGYTNDKSTGIRHALMDNTNVPGVDEAVFMIVACSAFINYLAKKKI